MSHLFQSKTEIERKFLLTELPKLRYSEILLVHQYYLNNDQRIRRLLNIETNKVTFENTIKRFVSGGESNETDLEPLDELTFNQLKNQATLELIKTRYIFPHGKFKWDIDYFNIMLVIGEIEVPSMDTKIIIPTEISEVVIKEVTGDRAYSSKNLSTKINK